MAIVFTLTLIPVDIGLQTAPEFVLPYTLPLATVYTSADVAGLIAIAVTLGYCKPATLSGFQLCPPSVLSYSPDEVPI